MGLLVLALPLHAQPELSRQEAEQRLQELKLEISELQESLQKSRSEFTREQNALRKIDLEVQQNALRLRELDGQRQGHQAELLRLETDRANYIASLQERKAALGEQIVAAYQLGRESRLKLLLNQDSPARLGRMMAYYDYFSRAQVDRIRELRVALETLDRMQAEIDAALSELAEVQRRQEREARIMEERREERNSVLTALSGTIGQGEARMAELTRNRADLEALLERLGNALADIPADLGGYRSPAQLRGALPLPVQGRVRHAFGQTRGAGLSWHGWLIEAPDGTEVRAIAYGRVAYADWLRGYGLMMIIDHGDGFMSLYGNNESLLFEVGDWVQPNAVISTVGAGSGTGQGLYFELRNQGKAVDPATWIAR